MQNGIVDKEQLKKHIAVLIYGNSRCRVGNHAETMRLLRLTFTLRAFSRKLSDARANWIRMPGEDVLDSLARFLEDLK